ncbi:probable maltase [Culicoides brevitarsis]|uniref:probable maltase n=1 Tax=Culicoides brevitarsis TaxID=469753 RepID=UPI00307B7713
MKGLKFLFLFTFVFADDPWYKNANYYQVYPRSFKDSDSNGIGDIRGVIEKLPYLHDLGMDGIWLNPIMKSPQADAGYDISDYREIESLFGTMEDFLELLNEAKQLGMHLIMDFVPNHTSNEHEWFIKSENGEEGYEDYYIWHPGTRDENGDLKPPNEWVSVMVGSMWEWSEKRQAFYFHQFLPQQPDLNYRNPKVVEEMKNVMRFWLEKGISGFRIDAVPCLFEVSSDSPEFYLQEPPSGECDEPTLSCYYKHIYTQNQSETYDMVAEWRSVLNEFSSIEPKVMMLEVLVSPEDLRRYYTRGADIPFNFEPLYTWKENRSAWEIRVFIENYLNHIPDGNSPNWVLGNHDNSRLATRLGEKRIDLFNILLQTLPGNAVTYNGEEFGMTDVFISWEDTQDPQACATNRTFYTQRTRDPARTPFQWNSNKNAGFSDAEKTWLPVGSKYVDVNVEKELKSSNSHLKIFKKLVSLHKLPEFRDGKYESSSDTSQNVFSYVRSHPATENIYIIALNFGKSDVTLDMREQFRNLPSNFKIVVASLHTNLSEGTKVSIKKVTIPAEAGVVFISNGNVIFLSTFLHIFLMIMYGNILSQIKKKILVSIFIIF